MKENRSTISHLWRSRGLGSGIATEQIIGSKDRRFHVVRTSEASFYALSENSAENLRSAAFLFLGGEIA